MPGELQPLRELPPDETGLAFRALAALRPHLRDAAQLVDLVDRVQRPNGYRLLAAFEPKERHEVRATEDSRLLLLLSPWPGEGHPSNQSA